MGINVRQAATRIFSNASGSYSSNVNLAVENSSWSDEQQLQEMYLSRKSFAFNSDRSARLLCIEPDWVLLHFLGLGLCCLSSSSATPLSVSSLVE